MEQKENHNKFGDIQPQRLSEEDWRRIRQDQHTYIFKEFDENLQMYVPVFKLSDTFDEKMEEAMKDPKFMELELYKSPDQPPYDFYIRHSNDQLAARVSFFKEVFDERFYTEGYQPDHKYYRLILKKSHYIKIMTIINKYFLLPMRDLLLEVIAIAQDKYITDVSFWDKKEMRDIVKNAKSAAEKAIEALEKLDDRSFMRGEPDAKPPSELRAVQFIYNDGTVKIDHSWMAKDIMDNFKRAMENGHYKDWRKELKAWPGRFENSSHLGEFQHDLALSYYNLFSSTGAIKVTPEEPTPNQMMECIAALIGLSSIPIGGDDDVTDVKAKGKNIRTWLNRYKLEPTSTHFELKANKERLLKYFPKDFVELPESINMIEALNVASYIAYRFDIPDFLDDLAHIIQALIDSRWMIDHQVLGGMHSMIPSFDEFNVWRTLMTRVDSGGKITSVKFRIEGSDQEHELHSEQPLGIIAQALHEFANENRHDVDVEAVPTQIYRTPDGNIGATYEPKFQDTKQRFLVRFVTVMYEYLRKEVPPRNHQLMPSLYYYPIIAAIMAGASFFNRLTQHERWIIEQVKHWHKLGLAETKGQ